ncbi:MAG: hypothetical protein AABW79_01130 [Nanoarchaeota archaeon]
MSKEKARPDKEFYEMGEIEATRQYFHTIEKIRREKGPIAAMGYEIKSTLYSIGKRIANLFEEKGDYEQSHQAANDLYLTTGLKGFRPSEGLSQGARYERENRLAKRNSRTAQRKEFILRGKRSNLEKNISATTALVGLFLGIFFLSPNLTGNVIGLNQDSSNLIGGILFLIGLIGTFVYFKFE